MGPARSWCTLWSTPACPAPLHPAPWAPRRCVMRPGGSTCACACSPIPCAAPALPLRCPCAAPALPLRCPCAAPALATCWHHLAYLLPSFCSCSHPLWGASLWRSPASMSSTTSSAWHQTQAWQSWSRWALGLVARGAVSQGLATSFTGGNILQCCQGQPTDRLGDCNCRRGSGSAGRAGARSIRSIPTSSWCRTIASGAACTHAHHGPARLAGSPLLACPASCAQLCQPLLAWPVVKLTWC
jgi:hypothetical protein